MEHTLHSDAPVLLISRSQSEGRSKMEVCNPPHPDEWLKSAAGSTDTSLRLLIHRNNGTSSNCTFGFIITLSLILKTKEQLQISRVGIMGNSKTDLERKIKIYGAQYTEYAWISSHFKHLKYSTLKVKVNTWNYINTRTSETALGLQNWIHTKLSIQ